ncbi:hypothetical protein L1887_01680 [Cichorium endivia]|nr:hypothetical protein L1887_01680 [Cichorium endivia]
MVKKRLPHPSVLRSTRRYTPDSTSHSILPSLPITWTELSNPPATADSGSKTAPADLNPGQPVYRTGNGSFSSGAEYHSPKNRHCLERSVRWWKKMPPLRLCRRRVRHHALEVMEWMDKRDINFSHTDLAVRLDLISKVRGVGAAEGGSRDHFRNLLHVASIKKAEKREVVGLQQQEIDWAA